MKRLAITLAVLALGCATTAQREQARPQSSVPRIPVSVDYCGGCAAHGGMVSVGVALAP